MLDVNVKMFKFLFFLQVLFATELCGWQTFHRGRRLGEFLTKSDDETFNTTSMEEHWLVQPLNHSDPTDQRKWNQRYFVTTEYYQSSTGGPVFLMIGGEGKVNAAFMESFIWIDYAQQYGALCFLIEHRFYGESHPTEDVSVENLQYLTSEQALADSAAFIVAMNEKYHLPTDVKWIAFGGSYAGSLAAWLRLKYPHLVHGAVSSSGPLLAQVDFKDYFKIVTESLGSYDPDCVKAVKEGFSELNVLLQDEHGQQQINELFQLCDPVQSSNPNDISKLYLTVANFFAGAVQYDHFSLISNVCDEMTNEEVGKPVKRLAAMVRSNSCFSYKYDKRVTDLQDIKWSSGFVEGGARQWTFQTCNEFGFFQTSSESPHIFGNRFPVEVFEQECIDVFGPEYNLNFLKSAVENTNLVYGGLNIDVSNVVFVHGSIDPWHALGVLKNISSKAPAIFIKGTSHCLDMFSESHDDIPELRVAREKIATYIGTWLQQ